MTSAFGKLGGAFPRAAGTASEEGIASNILADRLKRLVEAGLLTRAGTIRPTSRRRSTARPSRRSSRAAAGRDGRLGPAGTRQLRSELSIRAQLLEEGGPPMWEVFMAELRGSLPSRCAPAGPSVLAGLQAAYEAVVVARPRAAAG